MGRGRRCGCIMQCIVAYMHVDVPRHEGGSKGGKGLVQPLQTTPCARCR